MALPAGRYFQRSDADYEAARAATVWNARLPDRFPDLIVQARDADDVVAAIRHAKQHGLTVGMRSGGHSWAANHVRDGGMLIDVSRLDQCRIDTDRMVAVVGPGKGGSVLAAELDALGLFFPVGHCKGVCIGGYLLQGGYGWNSRVLGPACESVIGVEVVTADGERRYCDADNDPELYWAARGSGPGFFAVVTAFHLRLYPRPGVTGSSLYIYPIEYADEIFSWARSISAEVDRRVELQIVTSRAVPGAGLSTPGIVMASPVFADDDDRRLLQQLRRLDPDALVVRRPAFHDARLEELLFRYVARNFPHTLDDAGRARWEAHRAERLFDGAYGHRTVEQLFDQIDRLSESVEDARGEAILGALYDYAETIAPHRA